MSDLGDLGDFLKEGALTDLSWLDVDEKKYRESEPLPMQNLDVQPDLEALWAHEGKPSTAYKEKDLLPQTMGDLSEAHGPLRKDKGHDIALERNIVRTVRLAMMQSSDPARIKDALFSRYDRQSVTAARTALASVMAERGLLGPFYIEASDFAGCHNSPKSAVDFVRRFAGDARYVVAKAECESCIHALRTPVGSVNCAVFHKEIVVEVPYSDDLAARVEESQKARGKVVLASTGEADPRERIRLALLAPTVNYGQTDATKPVVNPTQFMKPTLAPETVTAKVDLTHAKEITRGIVTAALADGSISVSDAQVAFKRIATTADPHDLKTISALARGLPAPERRVYEGAGQQAPLRPISNRTASEHIIAASNLTKKRDEENRKSLTAHKAKPIVALLRRELLKGRGEEELAHALKLSFKMNDLQETRDHWEPIFKEAGLYGTLYSTQDSFEECREGADFLAKHNASIKTIVAGTKCDGCVYNKIGRCLLYGKPLVKDASEMQTWDVAQAVLSEHKQAGRIAAWDPRSAEWGATPREALKAMHREAGIKTGYAVANSRMDAAMAAFRGTTQMHSTGSQTKREIMRKTARYLNEGLYGRDLLAALRSEFDPRDLKAATPDLRGVIAEQGLQGIYFVDPTIYDDYGRGCDEAGRLFRAKGVPYVKVGEKCASCVHQSQPGMCSKINKPLVFEPPYIDKQAQQQEILASGDATAPVDFANLQNNGMTIMAEYQLQHGTSMDFELNPTVDTLAMDIQFSDVSGIKL